MADLLSRVHAAALKMNNFLLFLGALSIFMIIIVDGLNVVGAKIGIMIVPSGKTIIEEMLVVVIYIGLGYVMLNQGHIKTDILKSRVPKKAAMALDIAGYGLMLAISCYVFIKNADAFLLFWSKGTTLAGVVEIPKWPVQLLLAVSFLNMAICTLLLFIRALMPAAGEGRAESR